MTLKTTLKVSDLKLKSREELLALVNIAQKVKVSQQQKKLEAYFETAHSGQTAFHRAPQRIRYIFAGNRGGKTTAGCVEMCLLCLGIHPHRKMAIPLKSIIISPDFENHTKSVLQPKFEEWAPAGAIREIQKHQGGAWKRIIWSTGSTTDIFSHDQDRKVFEGSDFDVAWADEPPPRDIWNAVWRGLTDRGGIIYMTGTPLSSPWVYDEYQKIRENNDPLRWYIQFPSEANAKNLGQGDEALGKKRLTELAELFDPEEKEARLNGGFVQLQGLIFKGWDRALHLIEPFELPYSWPIIESIDPHPQKPWAVTWTALAPNGAKILVRSAYLEGDIEDVANGILQERAQLPVKDHLRKKVSRIIIDNMSSVPTWQRSNTDPTARRISVREELENMIGPKVGAPRVEVAPKNVQQKIDFFKRWLTPHDHGGKVRPDFYVFNTPENDDFVHEIERYAWARFSGRSRANELKTQPIKKYDDLIDSVLQLALILKENNRTMNEVIDMTGGFKGYGRAALGRSIGRGNASGPDHFLGEN